MFAVRNFKWLFNKICEYDHRVLLGAKKFMKKKLKYIKGIIMEWQWFSGRQAENTILNLMAGWVSPENWVYNNNT
jgi:hypothetical protein